MKSLCVIPARGGSKRLPRKNIQLLQGEPLITYTIRAAVNSKCFTKIIVSSDDEEILSIAKTFGETVIAEKRPKTLSGDYVKAREIVWDIIDREENKKFDTITLMLPTAPHRTSEDIKKGFELLDKTVDGVISMTTFEMTPLMSAEINEKTKLIEPLFENSPLLTGETRSQNHKPIYRPNGCFYINWMKSFDKNRIFFRGKVRGYIMQPGVDIDYQEDLDYANFMAEKGKLQLEK